MTKGSIKSQLGYTLIELSIVMIIIGALVSGVFVGQNMIRTAEVRNIIQEVAGHKTHLKLFKDTYGMWPGDLTNAHTYFDDGSNTACGIAADCNGNGDGIVQPVGTTINDIESFRAWQHMDLAKISEYGLTGLGGADADHAVVGQNVPKAKLKNAGYSLDYATQSVGWSTPYTHSPKDCGVFLRLGKNFSTQTNWTAVLNGREAYEINQKMDNGYPHYGNVASTYGAGLSWATQNCVTGSGDAWEYLENNDDVHCSIFFLLENSCAG